MKLQIATPADFDFLECINSHGWRQLPPFSWDTTTKTLKRVQAFADGATALLSVRGLENGIEVESDTDVSEAEIVQIVRTMLQLDIPIDSFHGFCRSVLNLAAIPERRQGRMLRSPTLFEDLVKVIATTNTTWLQTKGMTARLVEHFGTPVGSDPERKSFPTPQQIAPVPVDEFADKARMGYRSVAVHRIATDIANKDLDLESWQEPGIPAADLYKSLLGLPGVGPYAASCLMIYLGRYDRVNADSWARTMVGKELGRPVTDKEVQAFFAPYDPWQALVYHFYPWREDPPAY